MPPKPQTHEAAPADVTFRTDWTPPLQTTWGVLSTYDLLFEGLYVPSSLRIERIFHALCTPKRSENLQVPYHLTSHVTSIPFDLNYLALWLESDLPHPPKLRPAPANRLVRIRNPQHLPKRRPAPANRLIRTRNPQHLPKRRPAVANRLIRTRHLQKRVLPQARP